MRMDQVSGSAMRFVSVAAAAAAVFMIAATPAAACCHWVGPAYGVPVVPLGAIDPWYPVRQVYVVNQGPVDRKSTRLNSSHVEISYAVFCLKKKRSTNTN